MWHSPGGFWQRSRLCRPSASRHSSRDDISVFETTPEIDRSITFRITLSSKKKTRLWQWLLFNIRHKKNKLLDCRLKILGKKNHLQDYRRMGWILQQCLFIGNAQNILRFKHWNTEIRRSLKNPSFSQVSIQTKFKCNIATEWNPGYIRKGYL